MITVTGISWRGLVRGLLAASLVLGVGGVCVGTAGEVEDLYEAQIPVDGQGDAERGRSLSAALERVLVKVTGKRDVAGSTEIQAALQDPMRYVQQYRYRPLPARGAGDERSRHTEALWVNFDAAAVNRLLQQSGLPLWGRTRPATLLWLAVEDRDERYVLSGDLNEEMQRILDREAQRRGIPLLLPLMDLEDRSQLGFTDVWGNFQDTVLQASARYDPGAVLVGRLFRESGGRWAGRWSLYYDSQADHWSGSGARWPDILAAGIDGAADRLATRFARLMRVDGLNSADLVVVDIRNLDDYRRAMDYLRALDPVSGVHVSRVEGDRVYFRLQLGSDLDSLVRIIELGNTLVTVPAGRDGAVPGLRATSGGSQDLRYRLLP